MATKPDHQDLIETLMAVGVQVETLATQDIDGLSAPTLSDDPQTQDAIERLPLLVGDDAVIAPGDVLGEGGMGVVSSAHQAHLNREVAVKTVRDPRSYAEQMLYREAQVLGGLQHPNVVPVHMLGADADGRPMLVMKRLEGDAWNDYMPRGEQPLTAPAGRDPLDWHLGVLMAVCNAVHYAHSRGVVHRDIKPGNVVVGEFGEVYLLDWGLAASISRDNAFGLTEASDIRHVAGTPGYLAPEMAAADGASIDERTDVYLLGGCLHTILTGSPRHHGSTAMDRLFLAFTSPPFDYGEDVPTELAGICNRAMNERREDRFPSALAFRQALDGFLKHRSSVSLAREAAARVDIFCEAVAAADGEQETAIGIHGLFGECHFGLQQALREWAANAGARADLQRLLEARIDYELEHGSVSAAEVLISELPDANPVIDARLRQRKVELAEEADRLRKLHRQWNLELGKADRSRVLLGLGTLWGAVYLVLGLLARAEIFRAEYAVFITISVVHGCVVGLLDWWIRRSLPRTHANRRFMYTLWATVFGPLLTLIYCLYHGLPFSTALGLVLGVYGLCSCAAAIAIDLRMLGTASAFVVSFMVVAAVPEWCYFAASGAAFFGLWIGARYWKVTEVEPPEISP